MKTYHVAPGSHGLIINEKPIIGHESSIAFVQENKNNIHVVLADSNTGICLARTGIDLFTTLWQMVLDIEKLEKGKCEEIAHVNFINCEEMG